MSDNFGSKPAVKIGGKWKRLRGQRLSDEKETESKSHDERVSPAYEAAKRERDSEESLKSQLLAFEEFDSRRSTQSTYLSYGDERKSLEAVRHMEKMRELKKKTQMEEQTRLEAERKEAERHSLTAEEQQELRRVAAWQSLYSQRVQVYKRIPQDGKDWSRDPSYTRFELPYHLVCRERYQKKQQLYEDQFQSEIKQQLEQQQDAFEVTRLVRHLCYTTLWPPLHSEREITTTLRHRFRLPKKQFKKIRNIMDRLPEVCFS